MFGLGVGELVLIFAVVLLVFGAKKLPQIGAGLGQGIQNFRKSVKGEEEGDKELLEEDEGDPGAK
jgi:sec-independent protein translocase protein TatA